MLGAVVSALPVLAIAETGSGSAQYVPTNEVVGSAARAPDLWAVDIGRTGPQCIIDPNNVHLWRAVADNPAILHISGPANFPFATINFASSMAVLPLDAATFPISDGSRMVVTDMSSGATIAEIDFVVLTSPPGDRESLVRTLKARGCSIQLERLAASSAPRG